MGDRPPQPIDPNQNGGELGMSEDCLYLSVETPAKSKNDKLPVFVMIHGGAFLTGSYSGTQESFVKEGIIYCSIEYRLGALGFMAHPELSKESGKNISGNYGILDQVMALKWIHDNIAAFGGDPDKITIAGESAGGISVSILCASPLPRDSSEEPSAKVVAPSGLWVKAEMVTQPCSPPKRQKQVDFSFKRGSRLRT